MLFFFSRVFLHILFDVFCPDDMILRIILLGADNVLPLLSRKSSIPGLCCTLISHSSVFPKSYLFYSGKRANQKHLHLIRFNAIQICIFVSLANENFCKYRK